jgi:hypothetical protein
LIEPCGMTATPATKRQTSSGRAGATGINFGAPSAAESPGETQIISIPTPPRHRRF